MSAEEIFRQYVRHVGIGGIAMAGIIGIIRSSKIIRDAVTLAVKEIFEKKTRKQHCQIRTQLDISMKIIVGGLVITAILTFHFLSDGCCS